MLLRGRPLLGRVPHVAGILDSSLRFGMTGEGPFGMTPLPPSVIPRSPPPPSVIPRSAPPTAIPRSAPPHRHPEELPPSCHSEERSPHRHSEERSSHRHSEERSSHRHSEERSPPLSFRGAHDEESGRGRAGASGRGRVGGGGRAGASGRGHPGGGIRGGRGRGTVAFGTARGRGTVAFGTGRVGGGGIRAGASPHPGTGRSPTRGVGLLCLLWGWVGVRGYSVAGAVARVPGVRVSAAAKYTQ